MAEFVFSCLFCWFMTVAKIEIHSIRCGINIQLNATLKVSLQGLTWPGQVTQECQEGWEGRKKEKVCVCVRASVRQRHNVGRKKNLCESGRQESTLDGKRIYKRLDLSEFELWLCTRATYSSSEALSPNNVGFFFEKKKTFWQFVNTVLRAEGQEAS